MYILSLTYEPSTAPVDRLLASNVSSALSNAAQNVQLEARAGYFGLCIRQQVDLWLCATNVRSLTALLPNEGDPLNIVGIVREFKDGVVFSGLL